MMNGQINKIETISIAANIIFNLLLTIAILEIVPIILNELRFFLKLH